MRVITIVTFWSFFFLVVNVQYSNNASLNDQGKQGLYDAQDDVEILTGANFKQEIYGNKRALLVEFYNSWCGFCQRFAPSWKALATDVKAWSDLIGIAAIDCSQDDNHMICTEFEVMAYPTLKYFHENYQEDPKNLGLKITSGGNSDQHRLHLLETIIKEQSEGRGKQFPVLSPYEAPLSQNGKPDLNKLLEDVSPNVEFAFLIIQDSTSHVGQELILDFHSVQKINIRFTYTNSDYDELREKYEAKSLPAVFVLVKKTTLSILPISNSEPSRGDIKIAIEAFLKSQGIDLPEIITPKKQKMVKSVDGSIHSSQDFKGKAKEMGDVVFQMDLENTLRYSLKRETARKTLADEKLTVLKSYVDLLIKYFPFGKNGKALLNDIDDLLDSFSVVKGSDISKMIIDAEKEERDVFSSPPEWLACKGSSEEYRGYPCGLWKLFHFLTVNAALDHSEDSNPRAVLEVMHGYIKNFFGCADCSQHFQEMAQRREIDKVSSYDESILWLWRAHNEVNERLHGDATEDPEFPKIQFPSKENCPKCYDVNNNWNTSEVLRYLKHMYSSINVRHLGSDTKILHLGLEGGSISSFRKLDEYYVWWLIICISLYMSHCQNI